MTPLLPEARMFRRDGGIKRRLVFSLAAIIAGLFTSPALAQGKGGGKPGGGGGGGGDGSSAAYTIIDLPGPYHDSSRGYSATAALRISDADTDGTVYVLGSHHVGTNPEPCVWTVSPDGTVAVTDLAGQLDLVFSADINSAGIIAAERDFRPMLRLPDGTAVFLADESVIGGLSGLNNPDANGVFQVVGSVRDLDFRPIPMAWNVDVNGNILSQTALGTWTEAGGQGMAARDISDSLFLGGNDAQGAPAIGTFDGDGQLQIDVLSFPEGIDGSRGYQIDDAGNLLADGISTDGQYQYIRAVIWPAGGGVIDLTAQTGVAGATGSGIALVDGEMQVVGYAVSSGVGFAYLFTGGSLVDLNPLSQGAQSWNLQIAEGVNTSGMICGQGRVGQKKNYQLHGFVLIPNAP